MTRQGVIFVLLAVAVICYYLPWLTHDSAGFTMNAFDLAEWTSLHPAVRSETPTLWTSFLLRLPQVMLAAALALSANGLADLRGRWVVRGLALLLALRFVPPTDFFQGESGDPNYRQLAWLTGGGMLLVLATIPLYRLPWRIQSSLLGGGLLLAVVSAWEGMSRARLLLDNFMIDVQLGLGVVGLSATTGLLVGMVALGAPRRFLARRTSDNQK
jgi:hypothetical protein